MSFNYNHCTLVGRVAGPLEIKKSGDVTKVNLTLAVDRAYQKENGAKETDFIKVVLWDKLADVAIGYLKPGLPTLIEGKIHISDCEIGGERTTKCEIYAENFNPLESLGK